MGVPAASTIRWWGRVHQVYLGSGGPGMRHEIGALPLGIGFLDALQQLSQYLLGES